MLRLKSLTELSPALQQLNSEVPGAVVVAEKKRSKYGNVPTIVDGIRFDSKLESRYFGILKNLWHAGEILWFTRQTPFVLPGGVVYRADFLVARKDGFDVVDVKGAYITALSRLKIKQMKAVYGITVKLWPDRKESQ